MDKARFHPDGIEDGIPEDGEGKKTGSKPVADERHQSQREYGEGDRKEERVIGVDTFGGDGSIFGSCHEGVGVLFPPLIPCARRAGSDGHGKEGKGR